MAVKNLLTALLFACGVWCAHGAVNCTETGAGRFADDTDTTCQGYTLCVYVSSTASYISYNYTCPSTSVFNPTTSMCTDPSNYVCNITTTTTNSTNTTSVCSADGYIADSNSTDCSSYIECVEINGTYVTTSYSCPSSTYFDPSTELCESNYTCTSTSTNSTNTTTTTFTCTAAGRFSNDNDTTCQTYYYCVLSSDGTYVQYEYTCPSTSVFSPTLKACTTSYTCPTA